MRFGVMTAAMTAFGLLLGSPATAEPQSSATSYDQEPYTHPQQMVQIAPGRRLNLYCTGKGSPTVVLDWGAGGPTTSWRYVQPAVAKFTRVCSYDRAGQGFSDPGPVPRDTTAIVDDLHALLQHSGLRAPYVIVGHSLAGLSTVLFADRYLPELAGVLLVDPAFSHQDEKIAAIDPDYAGFLVQLEQDMRTCRDAAASGHLLEDSELKAGCLTHEPGTGPALASTLDRAGLRASTWNALISERDSFQPGNDLASSMDSHELDSAEKNFGSLNLIVVTALNGIKLPGMTPEQSASMSRLWEQGHDQIAARSSCGINIVVPTSSHYIQYDRPDVVVQAIHQLVMAAAMKGAVKLGPASHKD